MNTGVISHKLGNLTHLGESIAFYLCFGWTTHQRITGHIYTGYEPNYSRSGGGAIG